MQRQRSGGGGGIRIEKNSVIHITPQTPRPDQTRPHSSLVANGEFLSILLDAVCRSRVFARHTDQIEWNDSETIVIVVWILAHAWRALLCGMYASHQQFLECNSSGDERWMSNRTFDWQNLLISRLNSFEDRSTVVYSPFATIINVYSTHICSRFFVICCCSEVNETNITLHERRHWIDGHR